MTDSETFEQLRSIAVETALFAATRIQAKRSELDNIWDYTQTKSSPVDPVTVVDTMAEDLIAQRLEELRPRDGLIGEEGSGRSSLSGVTWIVDPIDGTVNFLYGLPNFAVSIAAAIDGKVVAGAVVNVATGDYFSAARGMGATKHLASSRQEIQLQVNAPSSMQQTLLATGFSYSAYRRKKQAELLVGLLPEVRDIRRLGSAALDLCYLAAGEVDAYYEHGLNCWDWAAGALIAQEAGAVLATPSLSVPGIQGEPVYAAAPSVFSELHSLLSQLGGITPMPEE